MTEISRVALFGKLNSLGYRAIESATVFCKMRGNPYVELMHWIHQILQLQDSDLHRIIKQFNLDPSRLAKDITESLDRLPRGSTSISDLSSHVEEAVERGWVYGTLMFGESQVRSGHLIVGILKTKGLRHALLGVSKEFDKVKVDTLTERFDEVVSGSPEEALQATDGFQVGGGAAPGEASGAMPPAQMGKQEALRQFSVDLLKQPRTLVRCQMLLAEAVKAALVEPRAVVQNQKGFDDFAPLRVGHTNHGGVTHVGMPTQHVFHFIRVHVESGSNDEILLTVDDMKEPIVVFRG